VVSYLDTAGKGGVTLLIEKVPRKENETKEGRVPNSGEQLELALYFWISL